jgi:hypothetical protein
LIIFFIKKKRGEEEEEEEDYSCLIKVFELLFKKKKFLIVDLEVEMVDF